MTTLSLLPDPSSPLSRESAAQAFADLLDGRASEEAIARFLIDLSDRGETSIEIAEAAVDCPPGCGHTAEDPGCALDPWAAAGPPARQEQLAALRVLLGAVGQTGPGY